MNAVAVAAPPAPHALTPNSTAVTIITRFRPKWSEHWPATKAPTAEPSRTTATAKPVAPADVPNAAASARTVPLITEASKPKRNPARVEATQRNSR